MAKKNSPKKPVLADHKQVGSTFLPPFSDLGFSEASWVTRLPELIWMGLLNHHHGTAKGVELATGLAELAFKIHGDAKKRNFALASWYKLLTADEKRTVVAELTNLNILDALQIGLEALNSLYPGSPLQFIGLPAAATRRGLLLVEINAVVENHIDRTNRNSAFIQANVIYIAGKCSFLFFGPKVRPPNLNLLKDYPHTQESQRTASSVRAMSLGCMGGDMAPDTAWSTYYWNRGLELVPCNRAVQGEHR